MKLRMPKISGKINQQIIMVFILLVVVVFITAMPWASNTFHEALDNMESSITNDQDTNEPPEPSDLPELQEPSDENIKSSKKKEANQPTKTTEGFVSNVSFRDSATKFPGYPLDISNWNPSVNVNTGNSTPLDRDSLYMFNNAQFSPNCCAKGPGSGMSTSMGCICLSNDDAYYISEGRGGGNMNPSAII